MSKRVRAELVAGGGRLMEGGRPSLAESGRRAVPVVAAAATLLAASAAPAQEVGAAALDSLEFRHIGPPGNRTSAVAGVPGDRQVMYVGAASGGVWKTSDGGANWRPVFDQQRAQSIGALAVSPAAPNEVWAGTGEPYYIRLSTSHGDGLYKSTDGGDSWARVGLARTGRIADVEVHPRDPDVVYACAVGHGFEPQPERGVYRTRDGGRSWERVLAVDDSTGCSDLALDPGDPSTLYAGTWQLDVDTWGLHSGGAGSGVHVTRDGGDSWRELAGRGLPAAGDSVGKVAVAVAPSDPSRVYALLQRDDPTLYRSDDRGRSWRLMSRDHGTAERGPYYTRMAVSSRDRDVVYFASVNFRMTRDGGETIVEGPGVPGGDFHDLWVDPTDADRVMFAHDGGATITENGLDSFAYVVLPIAQLYQVRVDDRVPYWVYTNRQDGPSYRGPSRSLQRGYPMGLWHSVGGCESGMATPDTASDRWVWSGCYDSGLQRYDLRTGHARDVRVWPEAGYGVPPREKEYRWNWNFPIEISPHDNRRVYVGSQHVHVTENGGQSWRELSPDLTRDVEAHQGSSGQLSTDNLNTFSASTLASIQESPLEEGVIWAGSYDGLVWVSRDGGGSWTDVTDRVPGLRGGGRVSNLDPSRHDAGTAYLAVNRMESGDFAPYVYRTTDYGRSWARIDAGIERSVYSPVHVVKEDPERPGLLFAGTENGVWFSLDAGEHWGRLQRLGEEGGDGDLPAAPVYGLAVQEHADDLVVGTYGRGVWILDDVSPLRQMSREVLDARAHFFEPGFAYRFRSRGGRAGTPGHVDGENPPYGMSLDYWLSEVPEGPVRVSVLSAGGDTVRTLSGDRARGVNRVWWDLRHEPAEEPTLRTPPPGREWVELSEDDSRPLVPWDLDLTRDGPLAVPGDYTAVLRVPGGRELRRTVTVRLDPRTENTVADVRSQTELALRIRDAISSASRMIDRLEWLRRDLSELRAMLAAEAGRAGPEVAELDSAAAGDLRAGARELAGRAVDVERRLFDVNLTGAREDAFRNPNRLFGRLSALLYEVSVASDDHPPTDQQREVFGLLRGRLEEARAGYRDLLEERVPEFRERLRRAGIPFSLAAGK